MFCTVLFMLIMWRAKQVQVIPNAIWNSAATQLGNSVAGAAQQVGNSVAGAAQQQLQQQLDDPDWRPVIIGNPSGKMRRVNLLELGQWTRWTEIRRLNKLIS
jgi:hypothetical protein